MRGAGRKGSPNRSRRRAAWPACPASLSRYALWPTALVITASVAAAGWAASQGLGVVTGFVAAKQALSQTPALPGAAARTFLNAPRFGKSSAYRSCPSTTLRHPSASRRQIPRPHATANSRSLRPPARPHSRRWTNTGLGSAAAGHSASVMGAPACGPGWVRKGSVPPGPPRETSRRASCNGKPRSTLKEFSSAEPVVRLAGACGRAGHPAPPSPPPGRPTGTA
jgi:hypothetical protein